MSDHVYHPVLPFALLEQRVERPGGRPHDVAACLVVLRVLDGDARTVDERTHEPFVEVVAGVVVLVAAVLLQEVRHDIENAGHHLILRHRERQLRVQNREFRHQPAVEDLAELEVLRVVGDDGTAVHLRAGAHHRQHATDGQDTQIGGRIITFHVIGLPRVSVEPCGGSHALGIVTHGAATDREDEIDIVLASEFAAFVKLLHRRIRHHAGILHDGFAGLVQDGQHRVVKSSALDGSAAIGEHDCLAVAGQFLFQEFQAVLAEMQASRVLVCEISKHNFANLIKRQRYTFFANGEFDEFCEVELKKCIFAAGF